MTVFRPEMSIYVLRRYGRSMMTHSLQFWDSDLRSVGITSDRELSDSSAAPVSLPFTGKAAW